jgi:ubiquinone/menaquinone biosynthesis C-methylase UbiE
MKARLRKGRQLVGHLTSGKSRSEETVPASTEYALIDRETATREGFDGWHDRAVAERQDAAYRSLMQQMHAGKPRQDLLVAAEAVRRTGLENPLIVEVGCGSGYYGEILPHLMQRPVRYVGLDYSAAMVQMAAERYPGRSFVLGDGTALPFADRAFDIVLNGVSLMHILGCEAVIAESARVARGWCIFHTVPVLQRRKTTLLRKTAYGQPTIEVIFNEGELYHLLGQAGLAVRHVLESIPYNLKPILGEPTLTRTYLCEPTQC